MKTSNFIIISFKGTDYKVNIKKLEAVFSYLEHKTVIFKNEKQISELLEKYDLYNEGFLENVNKV